MAGGRRSGHLEDGTDGQRGCQGADGVEVSLHKTWQTHLHPAASRRHWKKAAMALWFLLVALMGFVSPEHLSIHHLPVSLSAHHLLPRHICQQAACRLQFQKHGVCHGACGSCFDSFVKECALKRHLCLHGPLHSHVLLTCQLCHVYFSHSHLAASSVAPHDHVVVRHHATAAITHENKCGSHDCQEQFIVTGHCWAKCIPCEATYGNRCRSQECEKQLESGRLWSDCAICTKYLQQLLEGSTIILGKSKGRSLARTYQPLLQAQGRHAHKTVPEDHHASPLGSLPLRSFPVAPPIPFYPSPGYEWYQPPGFYRGSYGSLQNFYPDVHYPSAESDAYEEDDFR